MGYCSRGRMRSSSSAQKARLLGAPEIVRPEKPALQEVLPQVRDLLVGELRRARVLDRHDRTVEQELVVGAQDEMVRLAVGILADAGLRQLREADHEVDVGVGIVGPPSLTAVRPAHLPVVQAAEVERPVEALRRRVPDDPRAARPLKVFLRADGSGNRQRRGCGEDPDAHITASCQGPCPVPCRTASRLRDPSTASDSTARRPCGTARALRRTPRAAPDPRAPSSRRRRSYSTRFALSVTCDWSRAISSTSL